MELFRVGVTETLRRPDGSYDVAGLGIEGLTSAERIMLSFVGPRSGELTPADLAGLDALLLEAVSVSAGSLTGAERLKLIARYGVGYDNVDVAACTAAGIIVTNAPDGSTRPMATVNLALILALSLRLGVKDRLVRTGRWEEWPMHMGVGLQGRTLGLIGMGHIGRETLELAAPLGMRHVVHDPYVPGDRIRAAGAEPVSLGALLRDADFVCLSVPLTPATRHLIGAAELALMKSTAFLVNASRGPVVDQAALLDALSNGRIAGAGLDVFEVEPIPPDDPLARLDNVILAPHSLGCTDECYVLTGRSATRSILDVAQGRLPSFVVNPEVLSGRQLRASVDPTRDRPQGPSAREV